MFGEALCACRKMMMYACFWRAVHTDTQAATSAHVSEWSVNAQWRAFFSHLSKRPAPTGGGTDAAPDNVLTHYVEAEGLGNFGLRRYLTLVGAGVPGLGRRDAQRPLVAALGVQRLEALVVGVGENAHGEDM